VITRQGMHGERGDREVESSDVRIDGHPAGRISLDLNRRDGKSKWFFNAALRVGVAGRQAPHTVLCCNFPDPTTLTGPALMEHQQVVTYFHEFGHLVHGLARGEVPYARLSRPAGDLMDLAAARRYRDRILAPGGTKPAAELVRDFLERPYDLRAFKAWLAPRE